MNEKALKSAAPQRSFRLSVHTHTLAPATASLAAGGTEARWLATVEKNISTAEAVGIDEARIAHRKWWDDFWNRSWIFAGGDADAEAIPAASQMREGPPSGHVFSNPLSVDLLSRLGP